MGQHRLWQRFRSSRWFPLAMLLLFIVLLGGGLLWWYRYRWNLPLLSSTASPTASAPATAVTLVIVSSGNKLKATSDFANGLSLTVELRDRFGAKVRAAGDQIISLSTDAPASSGFEAGDTITIQDGNYDASTNYKSTKAGVSTVTATGNDVKPATLKITTVAGATAGLAAISLHDGSDNHELKSQTEYSFETQVIDAFGNPVDQANTVNWQLMSAPTIYPIATNSAGKSIFNSVFDAGPSRAETIRASFGPSHQDYPVTVVP